MGTFDFLKSTRFWVMIVGATALYLNTKGLIGEAEFRLVEAIVVGFIGIRTVDRASEKLGGTEQ